MNKGLKYRYDTMNIEVGLLDYCDLNDDIISKWADLEERVSCGNAFLSPNFILPAIKYLTPEKNPIFLIANKSSDKEDIIIGLGIFEFSIGTKRFPLPHLKAYRTAHSYLGGVLVDGDHMQLTLDIIFRYLDETRYIFGIEFIDHVDGTELARRIEDSSSKYNMNWCQYRKKERAVFIPEKIDSNYFITHYSSNKRKALRRKYKYLSKLGEVRWDVVAGSRVNEEVIDRFLRLEHMGWKGEDGSSMLSNPKDERFFREMIGNFANKQRAFFTELSLGDKVIASASNLVSSRIGFGFKIGWDINFSNASPGILNDYEFIKSGVNHFRNLEYIDSGAEEGSYIESIWLDRINLVSGIYSPNNIGKPVMNILNAVRKINKWRKSL